MDVINAHVGYIKLNYVNLFTELYYVTVLFMSHPKGYLLCKIHFYMVFEHKYVSAVGVHHHIVMVQIRPLFFFNPHKS